MAIEFGVGGAALPSEAANGLSKAARELRGSVALRIHIAGHVQSDEDPRLASQRAMAVGGVLIALGVLPLQLRAKGYGARVPLSRHDKLRLGLKSARRVTLHSLAEVKLKDAYEFPAKDASPPHSESERRHLKALATLLASEQHKEMRLSVEGHTDDIGLPAENAKLSLARAATVCKHLESLGVDSSRLVPHGFGAAFPIDDNGTEAGRQHNRRTEFLIIPTCFAAAVKNDSALSSHISNRPGVATMRR